MIIMIALRLLRSLRWLKKKLFSDNRWFDMIAATATIAEKVNEDRGDLGLTTSFAPFVKFNMAAVNRRLLLEACFFFFFFFFFFCSTYQGPRSGLLSGGRGALKRTASALDN